MLQSGSWQVCPVKGKRTDTNTPAVSGHRTSGVKILKLLSVLSTMQGSFLQARCEEPIMTTDWGLPLIVALLLLGLLYGFLYLPALTQRALLEQAITNQSDNLDFLPKED